MFIRFLEMYRTLYQTYIKDEIYFYNLSEKSNETTKSSIRISKSFQTSIKIMTLKGDCDGRESNPGQLLGRQLC